jgi:dynein heavy chain
LAIVREEDLCSEVLVLSISVQGKRAFIALGDKEVECNPNFRMYLATNLSNPVFNPALYAKANVIDCTVTALVSLYMHSSVSASDIYRR